MSNLEEELRSKLKAAEKETKRVEQEISIAKHVLLKLIKDLEKAHKYEDELTYILGNFYSPPPGDFA